MEQTVPELLRQGLIITALGLGLVFAALGLLWGLMALLTRIFVDPPTASEAAAEAMPTAAEPAGAETAAAAALTAERARVAAIVAGALMANAIALPVEVPTGPMFEHGRTAPIWVTANRARVLRSWQPLRVSETQQPSSSD